MNQTVELRSAAERDVTDAVRHLSREAGAATALGFVDDLEQTLTSIAAAPGIGSPRFADELGLPGLRARSLARHPYLVFYRFDATRVDIWRVLHTRRDLPPRFHADSPS